MEGLATDTNMNDEATSTYWACFMPLSTVDFI